MASLARNPPSPYPPGATNANWFSLFNAVSFQITLGAPMILYAKSLGATTTVLGIIASLTPILTVAQIPAARFLATTGYRKFFFRGWSGRSVLLFVLALVPLLGFADDVTKIALILFSLFIFNLLRGIASGAWLPWLTDLIPETVRGRFLSRDQLFLHGGSLFSLLVSAILLRGHPAPWQFSAMFFVSAGGALASLFFLRRIPDIDAHEVLMRSSTRVPWREIVQYPPFLRLIIFSLLWVIAVGAVGVFNVTFLKTELGCSESLILSFNTIYFCGAMISLPFVGRLLDRTGSKAVLRAALVVSLAFHLALWILATRLVRPSLPLLATLFFFNGMAGSNFGLAHVRLTMNTMPVMGRSHFFALFTVIQSLGLGLSPLFWGLALDAIGSYEHRAGSMVWNRFSIFYGVVILLIALVGCCTFALHERAAEDERISRRSTFFGASLRQLQRLWQR